MAGRQSHVRKLARIPCAHDEPAVVGCGLQFLDKLRYLVDDAAVGCAPIAPLDAVHAPQVTLELHLRFPIIGLGVVGPDSALALVEQLQVFVARAFLPLHCEEPEELALHRLEGQLLGGDGGKSVRHVETHLHGEERTRHAVPRLAIIPFFHHPTENVVVYLHPVRSRKLALPTYLFR